MKPNVTAGTLGTFCHNWARALANLGDILHGRWTRTAEIAAAFGEEKTMTKNAKLATAATVALLFSFATMVLLHAYGPQPSFMHPGFQGTHPMSTMWMGWLMALGPIAMILFVGGILTLVVLLVRSLTKSD
jgi:uncharacterized membrane protein (DUF485 family)